MKLKGTTKFLAKKYQDQYLARHPQLLSKYFPLVTVVCLMTAIKFHQTEFASQMYSFDYWAQRTQGQFSKDELKKTEQQLLEVLNDNVNFVTPYDFLTAKPLLPHLTRVSWFLADVIDFSLTIPELQIASAESIFFGSYIYSCQEKKQPSVSYYLIKGLTSKWGESVWVATILKKTLEKFPTSKQN